MDPVSDWITPLVYWGLCHQHGIVPAEDSIREQDIDDPEVENDVSNLYLRCRRQRYIQLLKWEERTRDARARVADSRSITSAVFTKAAISKWQQNFKSFALLELRAGAIFRLDEYEIRLPTCFEKPRLEIWIRAFEVIDYDSSRGRRRETYQELKDSPLIQPLLELRRSQTSTKDSMAAMAAYDTLDQSPGMKSQASYNDLRGSDGDSCVDSDKENLGMQGTFATQAPFTQLNGVEYTSPLQTRPVANSKENTALLRLISTVSLAEQGRASDAEGQSPEPSRKLAGTFNVPSASATQNSSPIRPNAEAHNTYGGNKMVSSEMKSEVPQPIQTAPITSTLRAIRSDGADGLPQEPRASMQAPSHGSTHKGDNTLQSHGETQTLLGPDENMNQASGRHCSSPTVHLKIHLINDRYLPRYLQIIPKKQQKLLDSDDRWQPPLVGKTERPGTVPLEFLNRLTEAADSLQIGTEDLPVVATRGENGDIEDSPEADPSIVLPPNILDTSNTQSHDTISDDEVPWSLTPPRPARELPPDSSPPSPMQSKIGDARMNMDGREEATILVTSPGVEFYEDEIEAGQKLIQVSSTSYVANERLTESLLNVNQVDLAHSHKPSLQNSFGQPGLSPPPTSLIPGTFQGVERHSANQVPVEPENELPGFELDSSEDGNGVEYGDVRDVMETSNDVLGGSIPGEPPSNRNEEYMSRIQPDEGRLDVPVPQSSIGPIPKISNSSPSTFTDPGQGTEGHRSLKRKRSLPRTDTEHQKRKKTVLDRCIHSDSTADLDFGRPKMMIRQQKREFHDAMRNQSDGLAVSFDKFSDSSVESVHTAAVETADRQSSLQLSASRQISASTPLTAASDHRLMPNIAAASDSSRVSHASVEGLQSLLTSFQQCYPSYGGTLAQFSKPCLMLKKLWLEGKLVPQCLWDDFVYRHHHDYRVYLLQVADSDDLESALSYEKFYDELKAKPEYLEQIITSQSLRALEAEISSAPSLTHASTPVSRRPESINETNASVTVSSLVSNIPSSKAGIILVPKPCESKIVDSFHHNSHQHHHHKGSKLPSSSVKLWLEKASGAESPELGTPQSAKENLEVLTLDISREEETNGPVSTEVQDPRSSVQSADSGDTVADRRNSSPQWWQDPHTTFKKFARAHAKLDAHDRREVQTDEQGLLRADVQKVVDIFSWR